MDKKKIAVALDTSTECCLVALGEEDKLLAESSQIAPRAHQKVLLSQLDGLLEEKSLTVKDVSLIAIGQGPGSYTGLRVGFATARALAQALEVPIFAFPSFEAIVAPFFSQAKSVLIAMDAKRNQIYLALYAWESEIKVIVPPSVYSPEEAGKVISEHLSNAYLIGDAFIAYPEIAKEGRIYKNKVFPQGEWLLKLGWRGYLRNGPVVLSEALPLYLRLSTAEESLLGNR